MPIPTRNFIRECKYRRPVEFEGRPRHICGFILGAAGGDALTNPMRCANCCKDSGYPSMAFLGPEIAKALRQEFEYAGLGFYDKIDDIRALFERAVRVSADTEYLKDQVAALLRFDRITEGQALAILNEIVSPGGR